MRIAQRRIKLLFALLIVGCMIYLIYPNNYMSKEDIEEMLREDEFTADNPSGQACVHPKLRLWYPLIKGYFEKQPPLSCSDEKNWVYVENGTFMISAEAERLHKGITCNYVPILWKSDFETRNGEEVQNKKHGTAVDSDFFEVSCKASDGAAYTNVHAGIAYRKEVHARASIFHRPRNAMGVNVLIYGIDSVSRLTYMRNLPRTYDYFKNVLGGVVMEGYNIVGDATPPALLALLTGKDEFELPDARRGQPGAKHVDGHPWIWNLFKNAGYATQFGEDSSRLGTFQFRMIGFENQPCDHYLRTYYLKAENYYGQNKKYCMGSVGRHISMMKYMHDFVDMYGNKPKWSFLFHGEFSHDDIGKLNMADNDIKQFLMDLKKENHLNNTILILMSDHGARFKLFRSSTQGKYEERLPFMGILLPTWFKTKYPDAVKNLHINTKRLTTPFDIHETFLHMLDYDGSKLGNVEVRGISLFDEVPKSRTCSDADIETHWCACLNWKYISVTDRTVRSIADFLVQTINRLTQPVHLLCERLNLTSIISSNMYLPKKSVLAFKGSKDEDGKIPDFRQVAHASEVYYQVIVETAPGNAQFEATAKYDYILNTMDVKIEDVSRINSYGDQAHCVSHMLPHLRKYCYCKDQLPGKH